jgi:hypothetical protein
MSGPESYINTAIHNEMAIVANAISSISNRTLNRSAFELGAIPGMTTDTAINALLLGEKAALQAIVSGPKNGQRSPRVIQNAKPLSAQPIAPLHRPDAASPTNPTAEPNTVEVPPVPNAPPAWSAPHEKGEPEFCEYGDKGPSARPEGIPGFDQPMASALPEPVETDTAVGADAGMPERDDERLYGRHAAQILRDCRRDVALAPAGAKEIAFQEVAKKLGQAVADQWLPKTLMVDRLLEIALAHGSFGLSSEQLQQLISDAAANVRVPQTTPTSVCPARTDR